MCPPGADPDARAHLRARSLGAPELCPRLGRELVGRGDARRRRDPEAAAAARRRHPHDRRPERARPRAVHPAHPADQRGGGSEHHRRHGRVPVPRAAELPRLPRRRPDHRVVRARDPRGHRRHRRQGGVPQVRRRAARADRRRPAHPRHRRCGEHRDRRADHGAHERRCADGAARARGARRIAASTRSASSSPTRATATTSATCARSPTRARASAATASTSRTSIRTRTGSRRSWRSSARAIRRSVHLGHDGACFYDFMFRNPPFADENPDYLHISRNIVPALLAAGVTQEQVDEMFVGNPRRFFAQAPGPS